MVEIIVEGMSKYIRNPMMKYAKLRSISNSINQFILLRMEDRLVGFMMFRIEKAEYFIYELHLESNCIGRGYGSLLMQEFLKIGAGNVSLCVHKNNLNAQQFYKKHGFIFDDKYEDKNTFRMILKNGSSTAFKNQ